MGDVEFQPSEIDWVKFEHALTNAFFSPRQVYTGYDQDSSAKKTTLSFLSRLYSMWKKMWEDSEEEIIILDPIWKQIWYGKKDIEAVIKEQRRSSYYD